ncbi:nitrous oxide reductase accessory protein NosL/NosD [Natrinema saccharevitans]|uniref:Nitrous oxide reductase accessory protein NosL/NosD n=1 Tax=Natrinema saccharevitans TaxID=301967 RepID=A0A1S8AVN2_9EURY|nr:NosD domain-containing protein [Natrinema saccharevitans]OLZ40579.1 nitrous oxide reductase accessory protein NosL/NosD [Natrinema saccharevitans]
MYRPSREVILAAIVLVATVGLGGLFVGDADPAPPEPVPFDETVSVGLTLENEQQLDENVTLPRAQAFYSQYQYVVGYYGVETFVDAQRQDGHEQRFGYPLAVYVSDYGATSVELNEKGYPVTDRQPPWIDATDAWFVVGSEARTPSGETVVSFADRADATAFATTHGGEVYSWDETLEQSFDTDDVTGVRDRVSEQDRRADATVESTQARTDRPVSTVVGADADAVRDRIDEDPANVTVVDTVQAGIDAAPANTTVLVSEGTYEETLEIDRPITLVGDGTPTISGDGNGSVVTVTEPRVGIRDLEITGVGPVTSGAEDVPGPAIDDDAWDEKFLTYYTGADAGISAHVAAGLSVENVTIETPSNGIILRESPDTVVRNATVRGNERWQDGFAGIMAFRSPGVVEETTIVDGRDAIYAYRSEGIVIRENTIEESLLGIHLMHTDGTLLENNRMNDVVDTGIYVMTGPERNAIVGNEIRGSQVGAYVGGSDTYVAENVLEANDVGLELAASGSIYERNVVAGNQVGVNDRVILPTNRVVENDFVGNDDHATAGAGPLRVWTHDGRGNYWQGATSIADGDPPSRSYSPTDTVDGRLHRTDGAATLARAPALDALSGFEASVSGMQTGSITDTEPACEPNNPDLLERTEYADRATACDGSLTIEP